jgi:hypothetical protein
MAQEMVRETVGVFSDAQRLEEAVDDLYVAGFDRAHLSLMATAATIERRLGHTYEKIAEAQDDPDVPRIAFVDVDSRTEAKGAAAAGLAYVGAVAAAGAVVASGGTLALAIAAAATGGGAGIALGAVLGRFLDGYHARNLQHQLERGGILLWVATPSEASAERASAVLNRHGAEDVHVHELPHLAPSRIDGVSGELTWIGKPILDNVLRRERPRGKPGLAP